MLHYTLLGCTLLFLLSCTKPTPTNRIDDLVGTYMGTATLICPDTSSQINTFAPKDYTLTIEKKNDQEVTLYNLCYCDPKPYDAEVGPEKFIYGKFKWTAFRGYCLSPIDDILVIEQMGNTLTFSCSKRNSNPDTRFDCAGAHVRYQIEVVKQ